MKLANVRIGQKMGLMIGASALQLVCLTGVAFWGVRTLDRAMDAAKDEGRRGALALSISSNANAVGMNVGSALLAKNFDAGTISRILTLRKEYTGYFEELATLSNTVEDKRHRETLLQTIQQWREANAGLIAAVQAGKQDEAIRINRNQVGPKSEELRANLGAYLKYRQDQLAELVKQQDASVSETKI